MCAKNSKWTNVLKLERKSGKKIIIKNKIAKTKQRPRKTTEGKRKIWFALKSESGKSVFGGETRLFWTRIWYIQSERKKKNRQNIYMHTLDCCLWKSVLFSVLRNFRMGFSRYILRLLWIFIGFVSIDSSKPHTHTSSISTEAKFMLVHVIHVVRMILVFEFFFFFLSCTMTTTPAAARTAKTLWIQWGSDVCTAECLCSLH